MAPTRLQGFFTPKKSGRNPPQGRLFGTKASVRVQKKTMKPQEKLPQRIRQARAERCPVASFFFWSINWPILAHKTAEDKMIGVPCEKKLGRKNDPGLRTRMPRAFCEERLVRQEKGAARQKGPSRPAVLNAGRCFKQLVGTFLQHFHHQ